MYIDFSDRPCSSYGFLQVCWWAEQVRNFTASAFSGRCWGGSVLVALCAGSVGLIPFSKYQNIASGVNFLFPLSGR